MKHEVYIKTLTCAICALEPLSHVCNWRGRLCLVFQCGCGTVQYSAVQKAACESLGSRCSLEIAGVRCLPPSVSCPALLSQVKWHFCGSVGGTEGLDWRAVSGWPFWLCGSQNLSCAVLAQSRKLLNYLQKQDW